jgi:4'-phosphopantetheinyl transferase
MEQLAEKTIYVWLVELNTTHQDNVALRKLLSERERQIADTFRFEQNRHRYIVAHGRLRQILSDCTGEHPKSLRFLMGRFGKPQLYGASHLQRIRFNLAHSGHLALLGVTLDADVGVDLEEIRPLHHLSLMANTWFSDREAADLAKLQGHEQIVGFYRCWTRKEALLKALGRGLSRQMGAIDVSLKPETLARLLALDGRLDGEDQRLWSIFDITPHNNYLGAAVARGKGLQLIQCQWRDEK